MSHLHDVKLEEGDTREALDHLKDVAEMSFLSVSLRYHAVWLDSIQNSFNSLKQLETFKSINEHETISQPPAAGVASHTVAYLDWLYAFLAHLFPKFQALLQKLSKDTKVEAKYAPQKLKQRVYAKAFYDYGNDYSRVLDIYRASVVCETIAAVVLTLEWIQKNCRIARFKNRFFDARRDIMARGGYRDCLINIEIEGFVFELQLHFRPLFDLKEESHTILDSARAIIEPTVFKLALLDDQQTSLQRVEKIKQLEREVCGLKTQQKIEQQMFEREIDDLKTQLAREKQKTSELAALTESQKSQLVHLANQHEKKDLGDVTNSQAKMDAMKTPSLSQLKAQLQQMSQMKIDEELHVKQTGKSSKNKLAIQNLSTTIVVAEAVAAESAAAVSALAGAAKLGHWKEYKEQVASPAITLDLLNTVPKGNKYGVIHQLAYWGEVECLKLTLARFPGLDLALLTTEGATPMQVAQRLKQHAFIAYLCSLQAPQTHQEHAVVHKEDPKVVSKP